MMLANDLICLLYVWSKALLGARLEAWEVLSRVTRSAVAIAHVGDKLQRVSLAFGRAISSLYQ